MTMPLPKDQSKVEDYKRRIGLTRMINEMHPPYEVEGKTSVILSDDENE
jgi:hypothetical protein